MKSKSLILEEKIDGMALAGIEIRYLVKEISKRTEDYYVSNIYGISRSALLFKLHHPAKPEILLMLSTSGLWITGVKIKQIEENRLVKRLRNDLLRSRITGIRQIGSERIVQVTFSGPTQELVLVCELFGDGNILLCNKDMKILSLLHSIDVRHRKLAVGLEYVPPPGSGLDLFDLTERDLLELRLVPTAAVRWIGRTLGLPARYAEEIARISGIDPQISGDKLSEDQIKKIFLATKDLIDKVVNGIHQPHIVTHEGRSDVYPVILGDISGSEKVPSFMEGLDLLYSRNLLEEGKSSQTGTVGQKILELEHKLEEQKKAVALVRERSDRIAGVAKALLGSASIGITSIEDPRVPPILEAKDAELTREGGITSITILGDKVKIDPNSSIQAIASVLFDESKRQLRAIDTIETESKKTVKSLEVFRKQESIARDSVVFTIQKKKEWYERYRWFFTSDGVLAIGGRDASSNSSVIRKHLGKGDSVFHAEIVGSPFFILKGSSEDDLSIKEVAQATVCFSRAWREGLYGLNAYWVRPDQVKTAAPSGQFIAKGSFIIEGSRNFVQVTNLQLALGIYQKNDTYSIMCGPPSPIKKSCSYFVIIEPSGLEMAELAKKIRVEFLGLVDNQEIVRSFDIDDFIRALPAGDSHIVESGRGEAYS